MGCWSWESEGVTLTEYRCVPLICIDWHIFFLMGQNKFASYLFFRFQYVTWHRKSARFQYLFIFGPFCFMCSWHDIPQDIRFVRIPRHMPSIKFGLGSTSTFDFSLLSRYPQSEIHKIGMYSSIGRMKQEFLISFRAWESRELGEL